MRASPQRLEALRRRLASIEDRAPSDAGRFTLGIDRLDSALGGGLLRGGLHEVYAHGAGDSPSAFGFAALLAERTGTRPVLWVSQVMVAHEAGGLYAPGLAEMGLEPRRLILVRARDPTSLLRAAFEGARCPALAAVVIGVWGRPKVLDLTASRRLSLAAQVSRVSLLVVRAGAEPEPSAAETRWSVQSMPSVALEANAPGRPAFSVRLLRSRSGAAPQSYFVEWDRAARSFVERPPLSGGVVPLPADRPAAAANVAVLRRAG